MAIREEGAEFSPPSKEAVAGRIGWGADKMAEFLSIYRQKDGLSQSATEGGTPYLYAASIGFDEASLWSELACDIQRSIENSGTKKPVIVWRERPQASAHMSERHRSGACKKVWARFAVEEDGGGNPEQI